MNSSEIDLQSSPANENTCSLQGQIYFWSVNLTSMLSPRFQAAPVILLATFLAWKHPSCFLTTFIFTKKAQPAHYIHVRQTLLFSSLTS